MMKSRGRVVVKNYLTVEEYLLYTRLKYYFGRSLMRQLLIAFLLCSADERCREILKLGGER